MKCIICGKEIEKSQYANAILCSSECFTVDFWNEVLDDTAIIINGECYHDAGETNSYWKGFGGRHFKIQMDDGRIIETENLWGQGKVPPERGVKDNAKFLF